MIRAQKLRVIQPENSCSACGLQFSRLSLLVNFFLAGMKAVVGTLSGSRALLASALYSINDVLSSIVVLVSLRVAQRPPDDKHAYGYGSAEFIAMGIVSLILAGGVILVFVLSVGALAHGVEGPPHVSALAMALLSLAVNLLLAEKGFCAARHLASPALNTSAEHNHVDGISSVAVAIGVGAALLGFHTIDVVIAIFETVHVMWLAGTLLAKSSRGLMDGALSPTEQRSLRRACHGVPGVMEIIELRTRRLGPSSWVDVVLGVSSRISVQHADLIAVEVRREIRRTTSRRVGVHVRFRSARARMLPESVQGDVS